MTATAPVSSRPKWATWLGLFMLIVGIGIGAAGWFDEGVTDLDDTRILQPVCSDLPQSDPRVIAGDCVTSREVLDADGGVDSPVQVVIGGIIAIVGLCIITGVIWPRPPTFRNR